MAEYWRASPASSAGRSESANREVALNCYHEVKGEICVSALTVPPPYRDVPEVLPQLLDNITDDRSMDVDPEVDPAFTVVEYNDEGEICTRFPLIGPVQVTIPEELIVHPHSKYEAVAPASTSIQAEHGENTCSFIIYTDDPGFDHKAFAKEFDLRAWEIYKKPMEYRIAEETAVRLHNTHGMDYSAIDRFGVTRPFLIHKDQRSGHVSLRHELDLRPSRYWRALPEAPPPRDEDSILDDIQNIFTTFCSLCITSSCLLHRAPRSELMKRNPPLMAREPLVTQGQLKSFEANLRQFGRTRRCGEECWNHPDIDDEAPLPELSPADHRRLESVLECRPDESTCALAIVARLPCFLIYQYRAQKFTSKYIQQAKERSDKIQGKRKKQTRRPKLPPKIAFYPCSHLGSCSNNLKCRCYVNRVPCRLSCRCKDRCQSRTQDGCECTGRCTENPKCPCFYGRIEEDDRGVDDDGAPRPPTYSECDPRRCKSCGASKLDYDRCGNMQMQAERVASIEVKTSKYGLGAFAMHGIRKNQVIGDYTGEICSRLYMDNMHVRDGFAISYIFEFQRQHRKTPVIEGATVGNSTRYINHAPKDLEANKKSGLPLEYAEDDPTKAIFANCEGRETIVDGDLRMLIYACSDIRLGEELRLDYGEDYWKGHTEELQEDTVSMDVDDAENLGVVVIEQRPVLASSKMRRKPGPGRDSQYIPELEDDNDGF